MYIIIFFPEEILYLEARLKNAILYTETSSIVVSGLLASQVDKLPLAFCRIHKSYIVNTLYVKSIQRYRVTLQNEVELPVSKENYLDIRAFLNYEHASSPSVRKKTIT